MSQNDNYKAVLLIGPDHGARRIQNAQEWRGVCDLKMRSGARRVGAPVRSAVLVHHEIAIALKVDLTASSTATPAGVRTVIGSTAGAVKNKIAVGLQS